MKIAIVKLSAMGDIIHAMVALQYLKEANPSLQIDWIVEQGFAPILEGNPHIDKILPVNLKAIKTNKMLLFKEIKRVKEYAKNKYDLVIDAQGLIKSALTSRLLGKNIAGFSKTSIREGVASYLYTDKVDIAYDANTIDRNSKVMSSPVGVEITSQMILDKKPFLYYTDTDALDGYVRRDVKNIVLVIGSTWESRNYPKEKFAAVANALRENVLIVWGTKSEKNNADWIAKSSKFVKVLPKINLNVLKELMGKSDLIIGNDTGPTHIAWGLNRPSITIFGPTPVSRVYETKINKVIKSKSHVNPFKLNKNDFSIAEIDAEEIVILAKALLNA